MIATLLSVAAFALLFALFGAVKPRAGCGGNCGRCPRGCALQDRSDFHG